MTAITAVEHHPLLEEVSCIGLKVFVSCRQSHLAGSVIEASAERMDTAPCSCKLRFWEFSSGEARWMVTGLDVDWWGDLLRSDGLHQGGQGQLLSQFSGGFVRSWIAGVWL
ncbi:MAG: hypothetical protein CMM01_24455 [Rhodopirellula sp.]|nr:hypothetical protein [Rhodopirellula sp.]